MFRVWPVNDITSDALFQPKHSKLQKGNVYVHLWIQSLTCYWGIAAKYSHLGFSKKKKGSRGHVRACATFRKSSC